MHPWPAASSLRGRRVSAPGESLPEQSPWGPCQPPDLGSPGPQPLGPVAHAGLCSSLGKSAPWLLGGLGVGNPTPLPGRETQHPAQNDSGSKDGAGACVCFELSPSPSLSVFVLSLLGPSGGEQGWTVGLEVAWWWNLKKHGILLES